jgi:hypothetical protein
MDHWVMDYETLKNFFCGVFQHYKTTETKIFVIHDLQNDLEDLIRFLERNREDKEWHISFNGLAFDAQVTHYILDNHDKWTDLTGCQIATLIHEYAGSCIRKSDTKEFQDYPIWKMAIGQIDLFKLHHWDNPAKRSSLKWIQFSMDWQNIIDMPIHHETEITTRDDMNTVIRYCINDVESTKEIYRRSQSQIQLRKNMTKIYGVNLFSASEPRIGKEIFSYYMSRKLQIDKRDIKKLRTYRNTIRVADVILPYIEFKSPEFTSLLERFKSVELDPASLKGSFKHKVKYKGVETHFGLGGVHGARQAGVFQSDDEFVIMSSDVTSFYPNLVIRNGWAPGHFPTKDFCELYEWFFDERKKIPKSDPMNYVYKIILNSIFGLSNDVNSFFYDPELCMRITVNGQLSLMMLYENIMMEIPGAVALMQNTDGIETLIPRKYIDKYMEICSRWEEQTRLSLEHDEYQKLILADVNNYIALHNFKEADITEWRSARKKFPHYQFKVEGSKFMYAPAKLKGRFDFHNLALHKNKSKLIIPKAIYSYFIYNTLPQEYLKENHNILDYCIGSKSKGDWQQYARYVDDKSYKEEKLQKINRYYISKSGVKIVKIHKNDKREIQLESGRWLQSVFNDMHLKPKWEEYEINTQYYLKAIEKEIDNILNTTSNQLELL